MVSQELIIIGLNVIVVIPTIFDVPNGARRKLY